MGTFSTAEPTNVAGWSEEVSGEIVSMYNQGKYGYAYYSKCAVTRLSDNSICVRIKMYSNAIMGWGAANKAAYIPWGSNGTENEFGPSEAYNYGSGYYLAQDSYSGWQIRKIPVDTMDHLIQFYGNAGKPGSFCIK